MFRTSKFWLPKKVTKTPNPPDSTGPEEQQCVVPSVPTVPGGRHRHRLVGLGLVGVFFPQQKFPVGNMGYFFRREQRLSPVSLGVFCISRNSSYAHLAHLLSGQKMAGNSMFYGWSWWIPTRKNIHTVQLTSPLHSKILHPFFIHPSFSMAFQNKKKTAGLAFVDATNWIDTRGCDTWNHPRRPGPILLRRKSATKNTLSIKLVVS